MGRQSARQRPLLAGLAAIALAFSLAACAAQPAPVSTSTPAPKPSAEEPKPTPTPTAIPELKPEGTAEENLEYFEYAMGQLLATTPQPSGRQVIDHLVASGFAKAEMELTAEKTPIGGKADNFQFSVRLNGTCLIGQSGNTGFVAVATPVLGTGLCLIGNTRPIDW